MAINNRTDNNYRSSSRCTFCQGNHTITGCTKIYEEAEQGKNLPFSQRTFKQHYAMQYIELKESRSKKRKTGTKKCGYCGGTDHTRRNCSVMEADREFLLRANQLWRRMYAHLSVEYGFAPASLIKYRERDRYNYNTGKYETNENLYLIGSELPTNLSVFALSGDHSLRQEIKIPAVGRDRPMSVRDFVHGKPCRKALTGHGFWWGDDDSVEIITKSTYQYPEEWFEGECDDIEYVLKKWKRERIERDILTPIRNELIPFAQRTGFDT